MQVEVVANIGSIGDAQDALMAGAEGVGLLRSEFLYLQRDHLPDEEEQYQAYRPIAETVRPPAGHPAHAGCGRRQGDPLY